MQSFAWICLWLYWLAIAQAEAAYLDNVDEAVPFFVKSGGLLRRDAPPATAPSGNYAPSNVTCPSNGQALVRDAASGTLSSQEGAYLAARRTAAQTAWQTYLTNPAVNLTDFNSTAFLANTTNLPNVAVAFSGGGYRAMLTGAGIFNAFDSRNATSMAAGTGGIIQLASYMAGLSGGNWLVGSLAINNLPTIEQLRSQVWNLNSNVVAPGGILTDLSFYNTLNDDVDQKEKAGFDVSITDFWALALQKHLINSTNLGVEWSVIANLSQFQNHSMPFPVVIADSRAPGEVIVPLNTTIFEFSPFEFGSWGTNLASFFPTQYLGTKMNAGNANGTCVQGFDNAAFVMGTSSSLFNAAIADLQGANSTIESILGSVLNGLIGSDDNDIAPYPNPFYGIKPTTFTSATSTNLSLVDGGESNENIPMEPVLQPARNVDVIIAIDSSADTTYSWPNGSSLVQTNSRLRTTADSNEGNLPWPAMPSSTNTYINQGLNTRPTFFGCNETNTSIPLIIYMANYPYISYTNYSTFKLDYTDNEAISFIENGLGVASLNSTGTPRSVANGTYFPACLACALIQRAQLRAGEAQSAQCQTCFETFCWNGVENTTTPATYMPTLPVGTVDAATNSTTASGSAASGSTFDGPHQVALTVIAAIVSLGLSYI